MNDFDHDEALLYSAIVHASLAETLALVVARDDVRRIAAAARDAGLEIATGAKRAAAAAPTIPSAELIRSAERAA